jgi:hypothetical protein
MPGEEDPKRELTDFEAELASLRPRSDRLDRQRLMFLAGQAAAATASRRGLSPGRFTRRLAALAAVALVAVGLTRWLDRRQREVVERIVYVPVEQAANPAIPDNARQQANTPPATPFPSSRPGSAPARVAPYLRELDQLLAQEQGDCLTKSPQQERREPGSGGWEVATPSLSRQSLDTLLDELLRKKPHQTRSTPGASHQGAEL